MVEPRITKKYRETLKLYAHFGRDAVDLDFSEEAALELFVWESLGKKKYVEVYGREETGKNNGLKYAKWALSITIALWRESWLETRAEMKVPLAFSVWKLFRRDPVTGFQYPRKFIEDIIPAWVKERLGGTLEPDAKWTAIMDTIEAETNWEPLRAHIEDAQAIRAEHYRMTRGVEHPACR